MTDVITQDAGDSRCECAGCGSMTAQAMLVFCPDCATEHSFCSRCANDAAATLAA
jgi:hypothetical protein